MKPLSVRQIEVLRRLATGDVLMACIHVCLADGTTYFWKGHGVSGIDHVHSNTFHSLWDRKLIQILKRDELNGSTYRISPAGKKVVETLK